MGETWYCPDSQKTANIDRCGGGGDDSCTPFPVKAWPDSCSNPDDRIIGGGDQAVGGWQASGADNYFIFHSCDGAGVQTDCLGQQMYIEQFGTQCPDNDWNQCEHACDVTAPGSQDGSGAQHQQCSFYHPGKQVRYNSYRCGWWYAKNQFEYSYYGWNEYKDWFKHLGLEGYVDSYNPDGTMVLYDWTCHGDDGSGKILEKFTGDANENCYCDNEPFSYTDGGVSPPPGFDAYAFWYNDDCDGKGPCLDVRNVVTNENFFLFPM